jgi:hypothetical protein
VKFEKPLERRAVLILYPLDLDRFEVRVSIYALLLAYKILYDGGRKGSCTTDGLGQRAALGLARRLQVPKVSIIIITAAPGMQSDCTKKI